MSVRAAIVTIMSARRSSQSDAGGGVLFAIFLVFALLWWLRWVILAGLIITGIVYATRWFMRRQAQRQAVEQARIDAIRKRAVVQNEQVLRGDPAGFFGAYPLPDPELIPQWYKTE